MRSLDLHRTNRRFRFSSDNQLRPQILNNRWRSSVVGDCVRNKWLFLRVSGHQLIHVKNENVGTLPALKGATSKIVGVPSGISSLSVLTTLPRSYENQQQGKKSQQAVSKLDLPPEQYRVFGGFVRACIAVAIGFFILMYGFGAWEDRGRLIGAFWLMIGFGFAFYGTIGFLVGWDVWLLF